MTSPIKKAQPTGEGRTFLNLLQGIANRCILKSSKQSAVAQTSLLYTDPTRNRKLIGFAYSALVSPMRCEFVNPIFVVAHQRSKITLLKEWIKNRPLFSTTSITSNGDDLETTSTSLLALVPMLGKWGSYNFNKREQ